MQQASMSKTKLQSIFIVTILVVLFLSFSAIGQRKPPKTNFLITPDSIGDIKLGMTIGEAKKVLPKGFRLAPADGYEGTTLIGVYEGKKLLFTIGSYGDDSRGEEKFPPINEKQKIEVMLIRDSRFKTAEGIHVGMSIANAEKKYGKLKEIINEPHSGQWGKFTNQPKNLEFQFMTKSNVEVTVGIYKKIPNCKITDSSDCLELTYAPNSYISEMSLSLTSPDQQTASSGNMLITKTSVGKVKLGMTVGEARKVLPKAWKLAPAPGDEGSMLVGVYEGKKLLLTIGDYGDYRDSEDKLPPINEGQKIQIMLIMDSRFKTAKGIHVGLPIAEAEKKYGKLKEMFSYPHEGEFGKFTNQPKYLNFYFKPKGDFNGAGIYEAVPNCPEDAYPPSCRVAKKYNPGSYISEMSVVSPSPVQQVTSITDTPKNYKVNIYGPAKCVEDKGYGETTYYISWKVPLKNGGYSLPSQQFKFGGLIPCPEMGYGENRATVSYKKQWDVFLDDFNFDGKTDLALRDGLNGGYGFPSYQVYLFSKAENKFVLSPSFTKLGQYQGMFEIDKKKKMIFNKTKSGAAFYQTDGYIVKENKLIKVYEETKEYKRENDFKVTIKKLVNGKWVVQK